MGKAKGVFQILWERGWINPDPVEYSKYTMDGPKDKESGSGRVDKFSLNYLIRKNVDFLHEKTLLQHNGESLGWIIDRSPKCTPEIAGDGIEFDWACAKMYYRKQPRTRKKSKKDFESLVKESLGKGVLTLARTRKFSKRSRQNMVAYYNLSRDEKAATPSELKKFKQEKKCHRSTLDGCFGFIQQELRRGR